MKRISTNRFLNLLFSLIIIIAYQSIANNYTFHFEGKKYEIVKQKLSWIGATLFAKNQGGYLVHINSQAEQDTIWSAIINGAKIPLDYTIVPDGGGIAYLWIGANDITTEGVWVWDGSNSGKGVNFWNGQGLLGKNDGIPVDSAYVNWGGIKKNGKPLEPDNFGTRQNAAAIGLEPWPKGMGLYGQAGEWNDLDPGNTLYFIIEYDETTYIEPNINEKYCIKEACDILINPIPFNDFLGINLNNNEYTSLSLYDEFGKEIISSSIENSNFILKTNELSAGVYILTLKNGKSITSKTIIKNY